MHFYAYSHSHINAEIHLHKQKLNCHSRLNVRKYFFANRIVNSWNALPANIAATYVTKSFYNRFFNIDFTPLLLYHL